MARFDVHKWKNEQYQKDLQSDQVLEIFIREYLSQNTTLDEGKLGDFFKKIKDKDGWRKPRRKYNWMTGART